MLLMIMKLLENDTMDSGSDRSSCSSLEESEHDEYWEVDEAEFDRDFNLCEDEQSCTNGSTTRLTRVTALFLLLWASFYSIFASTLHHLIKFCNIFCQP